MGVSNASRAEDAFFFIITVTSRIEHGMAWMEYVKAQLHFWDNNMMMEFWREWLTIDF
jgi:hypothetical protein